MAIFNSFFVCLPGRVNPPGLEKTVNPTVFSPSPGPQHGLGALVEAEVSSRHFWVPPNGWFIVENPNPK